jgi:hypothetical protein
MTGALPVLGLLVLIPLLLWLRQNMIVVLGCASAWLYYFYSSGAVGNTALDAWQNAKNEVFLAIPLYVLAGNVMANGSIAQRLIRVMKALTAPNPRWPGAVRGAVVRAVLGHLGLQHGHHARGGRRAVPGPAGRRL